MYPTINANLNELVYKNREQFSLTTTVIFSLVLLLLIENLTLLKKPLDSIKTIEIIANLEDPVARPKPDYKIPNEPIQNKVTPKNLSDSKAPVDSKTSYPDTKSSVIKSDESNLGTPTQSSKVANENEKKPLENSTPTISQKSISNEAQVNTRYESTLIAYLHKIKKYPTTREAKITRPEGIVKIMIELSRSGELINHAILKSSGSNILDSEAIRTLKTNTFPAFFEDSFVGKNTQKFVVNLNYTHRNDSSDVSLD
jgi:protein TonB